MTSTSLQEIVSCIGHPVAGNPTQYILERAFADAGLDARCLTLDVSPEQFPAAMAGMRAMSFRGAIIAEPHQHSVLDFLDVLDDVSRCTQNVDAIVRQEDNQWRGKSTLGDAVLELLRRRRDPVNSEIVIQGTGTNASVIVCALALAGVHSATLAGANASEGEQLVALARGWGMEQVTFQRTSAAVDFEPRGHIFIEAGSDARKVSPGGPLRLQGLEPNGIVLDLNHVEAATETLRAARHQGLEVIDGVEILVEKVSIAFRKWTGQQPNRAALREAVEEFFLI